MLHHMDQQRILLTWLVFVIENILTDKIKQYNWDDVASLPRDGSVILLDTRTELEYANGHIDGLH